MRARLGAGHVDGSGRHTARLLDAAVYTAGFSVLVAAMLVGVRDGFDATWVIAAATGSAVVFALPIAMVLGPRDHRMVIETPVLIPTVLLLSPSTAILSVAIGAFVGSFVRVTYEGRRHDRWSYCLRTAAIFTLVTSAVAYVAPASLPDGTGQLVLDVMILEVVALLAGMPITLLRGHLTAAGESDVSLWEQVTPSLLVAPASAMTVTAIVLLVREVGAVGLIGYAPVVLLLIGGYWLVTAQRERRELAALHVLAQTTTRDPSPEAAVEAAITAAESAFPGAVISISESPGGPGDAAFEMAEGIWLVARHGADAHSDQNREVLRAIGQFATTAIQRAQLQGRVARHGRLQTALLAAVGHDLQTPLTVQRGMAQMLLEHWATLPTEQRVMLISRIAGSAKRMSRTVAGLVDLKRIELGDVSGESDCCPAEVVRSWAEAVTLPDRHELMVDVAARAEARRVRIPDVHVERVIENLVFNACRYQPSGEPILLEVDDDDQELRISVADRGPGVAPEDRDRIFAAFGQSTASGPAGKVGLGLFIVARLVDHAGGRIRIDDRPGGGAMFVVLLPKGAESDLPGGRAAEDFVG